MSYSDPFDHPYRATGRAIPLLVIWLAIALALGILGTAGWLGYERFYQNQQTNITRAGNGYVSSIQVHLISLRSDYASLDTQIANLNKDPTGNATVIDGMRGQQRTIVTEMRQNVSTIQPDQVPPDVASFLAQHPYS